MKRGTIFTLAAILLVTPIIAAAAGLVPCGGSGEPACQACYVVTLMNNVIGWLVTVLTVVVAIVFVVSGLKLVTSAGNTSVMEAAKKTISNTFIGFVIVLSAWLLVDFGMKALLNGGVGNVGAGPWNSIQCTKQPTAQAIPAIRTAADAAAVFGAASPEALALASVFDVGDCSPANLQSLGMDATQAQVFSCMAGPESGCNNNADNPRSTARGVFQILRGFNNPCHNLNLTACTSAAQAAGWTGTGNLNCSTAFRGGHAIPGNPLAEICDAAASNLACNTAAALCLYDDAGGYGPWLNLANQGPDSHTAQRACVARYGG